MDATTNEKTKTTALVADAADRFVRYGSTGLAVQGDLSDEDAAGELLAATVRRLGALAPGEPGEVADRIIGEAVEGLAAGHVIVKAEAGRALLGAVARWFGIDFEREVEDLQREEE